jgi:hypothetical protein
MASFGAPAVPRLDLGILFFPFCSACYFAASFLSVAVSSFPADGPASAASSCFQIMPLFAGYLEGLSFAASRRFLLPLFPCFRPVCRVVLHFIGRVAVSSFHPRIAIFLVIFFPGQNYSTQEKIWGSSRGFQVNQIPRFSC